MPSRAKVDGRAMTLRRYDTPTALHDPSCYSHRLSESPHEVDVVRLALRGLMQPARDQAQTAQDDRRAGDQWARNTFDPSRRLARR
jgi:hypothetical protein